MAQSKLFLFWSVFVSTVILSGCSLELSIESSLKDIQEIISSKPTTAGITAASTQGILTSNGYEVQSSISFYDSQSEIVTTQGYTVQTDLQSALYKEIK